MEPSLYSAEVRALVQSQKWPKRLEWFIGEDDGKLWFVVKRSNYESLTGDEKFAAYAALKNIFDKLRNDGVPIFLDVTDDDGDVDTFYVPGYGHVKRT